VTFQRRSVLAGAAALVAGRTFAAEPQSRWSTGLPLPFAVQEIYPTLWRGQLVVGGGFRSSGPGPVTKIADLRPSADVVAMTPDADSWSALPSFPEPRHHPLLAALDGRLLAVGGFSATPQAVWTMQAQCWLLDTPAGTWRKGPSLPAPQAEVAAGIIDGRLILAGGRSPKGTANGQYADHADTGAAWALAPDANQWEALPPLPTPRNSSAAAVLNGRLHVAGGRIVGPNGLTNLTTHEAWDPKRGAWITLAPMPQPRGGHAAAVLGGRLYCFGGESFGADGRAHDEAFAYDPVTDRWAEAPKMPMPLHGLGAVTMDGRIHLLGGARKVGGNETQPAHLIFRG
jgi:N-acetylneuraminic acid mutarotase